MLDLIRLPFELAFTAIRVVFDFVGSMISMAFSILGGFLSMFIGLGSFVLIAGLIAALLHRRRAVHRSSASADDEDFVSFYAQDGKVE